MGVFVSITAGIWVLSLDAKGPLNSGTPTVVASPAAVGDALLENQWHLKARTSEVGGANVRDAWTTSQGDGIIVGIVDDGLQWAHPDLSPNYRSWASWDFNFNDADPQPFTTIAHGTAVAGVAGARGDNSIGVSGVAPLAALAGLRLIGVAPTDAQEAAALGFLPDAIDILNNSWGPSDNGTTLAGPGPLAAAARQSAATTGRNGKGRVFVWQAGNGRLSSDDCNFDGYANSRFVIPVGASTDAGAQASYSEGCSALMLLAPSGGGTRGLTTTDLMATPGYDASDYTSTFSGTSGAAPVVSGAVALMLAKNPDLTWRDVQHILRRTSVRIVPTDLGWTSGPFPHNERMGFGLLDAEAAVDLAGVWTNVPAEEALDPVTKTPNLAIPDVNTAGVNSTITISANEANFVIEHIEVDFGATHTWRGDLQIALTSPAGVVSRLAPIRPNDGTDNLNWRFQTVRHWGETAAGNWTLNVSDRRFNDVGTFNTWTLRIYGYHVSVAAPGGFGKSLPGRSATGQSTSPTLDWTAANLAASYEYCIDATNNSLCDGTWTSTGANTSAALSGLVAGRQYFWQVRAINATGITYADGAATTYWDFTTGSAPSAFVHTSPANGASGQSLNPTLTWSASTGATSYEYCYDTSNNGACNASWISVGNSLSTALSGLSAGTTYYWHVRANNAAGTVYAEGNPATFWSFSTVNLPGGFNRTGPGNGATNQSLNPTLTWGSSSGAASYEYCYDNTNDNACSGWTSTGTGTSAALSGLKDSTTYFWHVRALNTGGATYADGSATTFWSFTTLALPGSFSHASPSNGASGQALNPTLSWGASTGATSYEYCYDTSNNNACNASWVSVGNSTSAALSGLAAGTAYYWQVRANNAAGTVYADSSASAYWSFSTVAVPGAFTHSSPSNGASGQVLAPTLTWTTSAGATSYEYCVDSSNDNACSGWTGTGLTTSAALGGLTAGTPYYWHVRATNTGGTTYAEGSATAFWNFSTLALPGAFSHTSPGNGATGQSLNPTLSWGTSSAAANYEYCIDTTNDSACANWISVGTDTGVVLNNLTAGTQYFWHARAINASGTTYAAASPTAFRTFTTLAVPGAFSHTSPGNGATGQSLNPTLSWGTSSAAANYEYCIDITNDSACANWISVGTNTSVVLSPLTAGTPYYWHVRAVNASGTTYAESSATAFWSFVTLAGPGAFTHSSPANGATGQTLSPTLTWSTSATATGYEYCIDTTNDSACSGWTSTGTNTSAALSGLTAGTPYYWHVRAANASGTTHAEGSATAFWSFTTLALPGAFSLTSPANAATGLALNPTLSWGASAGAASYEYCIDTTNDSACSNWTSTGTNTTAALSGLTAGTPYYWHVRALNASGTTYAGASPTAFRSFTTLALPGAFTHTSPANAATGQSVNPTLTWSTSSAAASYEYCIDTTNDNACSNWTSTGTTTSAALINLNAGALYYWQVRAINASGTSYAEGSATAFWNFTTLAAPGAFALTSPANGATGQSLNPTLSWGTSAGATSYEYCVDTTNDSACSGWTGTGTNTSAALSNLTAGTPYYWHARAINASGTTYASGSPTAFRSFTTLAAPGAFSHISPSNGAVQVSLGPTLSWGGSTSAASYEYCIDTTNDSACSNWISTSTNTTVVLSGLTAGATYYWHSRAINASGTTYAAASSTAFRSFTTMPLPGAFTHSSPANGATGKLLNETLFWGTSNGASSYEYCIDTSNNNVCNATWISVGSATSVALGGLQLGTTYYWQVRAVNTGGLTYADGASTAFWNFRTIAIPGAFSHSSPANGATGLALNPTLTWGTSVDAASYEYCVDTTNDGACSVWTSTGTTTSAALSGLTAGATYYWHVRANNVVGATYAEASPAAFWSFTTLAAGPGAFSHSSPANGALKQSSSPTLSWTTSAGATSYEYCVDASDNNTCNATWVSTGTDTSAVLSGLAEGTAYFWQVRAINTGGTTYADASETAFWRFTTKPKRRPMVDLNGDGSGDVFTYNPVTGAWARQVSQAGGGFTTTLGTWSPGWTVIPVSFNTDALTDFFLFNAVSGQWFKMINTGTGFTSQATGSWWQGWDRFVMDLNGDGVSDLFLYDPLTGQWFKALSTAEGFDYIQGGWNAGWEIYPMSLNSDAIGDMFLIDRTTGRWFWVLGEVGGGFSYPVSEVWFPGWKFYPGDFNGDGVTDVLLHDPATGVFFVATADPSSSAGFSYQQGGWSIGWTPWVADFDGDGAEDLFLHDPATGVWFQMISNGAGGFVNGGGETWSLGWELHPTDFNGDGRTDLLLYDPVTGVWYQARNLVTGSFTYSSGVWGTGLDVVVRPPIR